MAPTFLGIEIGGTKLQIVAGDEHARIRDKCRFTIDPAQGGAGIRRTLETSLPDLLGRHAPEAVGVGFGGPVDPRTGRICCSHQIEGWSDFPLGPWLTGLTGRTAVIENDANTAALAEACLGAGQGASPVFYVTLGSGVGGGCVVDGRVYHGALPGEAEIGHLRLERTGVTVEQRCSGWALDRRIRALAQAGLDGVLAHLARTDPGHEARHLRQALAQGDPAALSLLAELADELAFALSHVCHLFHPERIVLGGGLSLLGQPLIGAVSRQLPRFLMSAFHPGPEVHLAALAEDAVPIGALLLARDARTLPESR